MANRLGKNLAEETAGTGSGSQQEPKTDLMAQRNKEPSHFPLLSEGLPSSSFVAAAISIHCRSVDLSGGGTVFLYYNEICVKARWGSNTAETLRVFQEELEEEFFLNEASFKSVVF